MTRSTLPFLDRELTRLGARVQAARRAAGSLTGADIGTLRVLNGLVDHEINQQPGEAYDRPRPDAARTCGVQDMTRPPVGLLDGFTDADRDNIFYEYFSATSDVGGHLPPVHSFARIFFRRRKLVVFASNAGAAKISVVLIDPKLTGGVRRTRFGRALWPGPRRHARRVGRGTRRS